VIEQIAGVLGVDKEILFQSAKKVDPEITSYVAERPRAADFLRIARDKHFDDDDWERITRMARRANLGKGKEEGK
jgi:hypothetical protein